MTGLIIDCLKKTPIHKLQILDGIAPQQIRSAVARDTQNTKQHDDRHLLYGHQSPRSRLSHATVT